MEIKQGQVKKPYGKAFPNRYNPDQMQGMLVVEMEDGTEEKIYGGYDQIPHCNLQRGDAVQIIYEFRNGKQIRRLAVPGSSRSNNQTQPTQPRGNNVPPQYGGHAEKETDITDEVKQMALNFAATVKYVDAALKAEGYADVSFDELRNIAVSMHIQLDRKYRANVVIKSPEFEQSVSESDDFSSDPDYDEFLDEEFPAF